MHKKKGRTVVLRNGKTVSLPPNCKPKTYRCAECKRFVDEFEELCDTCFKKSLNEERVENTEQHDDAPTFDPHAVAIGGFLNGKTKVTKARLKSMDRVAKILGATEVPAPGTVKEVCYGKEHSDSGTACRTCKFKPQCDATWKERVEREKRKDERAGMPVDCNDPLTICFGQKPINGGFSHPGVPNCLKCSYRVACDARLDERFVALEASHKKLRHDLMAMTEKWVDMKRMLKGVVDWMNRQDE